MPERSFRTSAIRSSRDIASKSGSAGFCCRAFFISALGFENEFAPLGAHGPHLGDLLEQDFAVEGFADVIRAAWAQILAGEDFRRIRGHEQDLDVRLDAAD